jgi:hypothetical protein
VDDILVNFDLERTRFTLGLLARMAERHQVIAFTCHPWLRECFEAEGARVVALAPETPGNTEAAHPRAQTLGAAASVGRTRPPG